MYCVNIISSSCVHIPIGHIPHRELVYRVLDLPPSMRPLVYDFGQLKKGTEEDYIKQIVHDHVREVHLSLWWYE